MKLWMIVLVVVLLASGVMAFSGLVQAAVGAMKTWFYTTVALLALSAAGYFFFRDRTRSA